MTLKQYLSHLWAWLHTFPRWGENEHTTVGPAGGGEYRCLICDYVERENEPTQ